jgi:uncharacterized DUF497 family protein
MLRRRNHSSPASSSSALRGNRTERAELIISIRRYIFYTVNFEFDSDKSDTNKQKHGIDFTKAQAQWDDIDVVEIPARTSDEPRSVVIGKIGARHWSAVITYRDARIRIISVRRSRKEEVEIYEG